MVNLKPGDKVDCRIESSTIVSPYKNYDEIKTFEIVATEMYGCYLYVPHYMYLKDMVVADQYKCKKLNIDKRFLNENILYIQENLIDYVHPSQKGMACCKCHEFYRFAEENQPNGTLICYSCKQNPYL